MHISCVAAGRVKDVSEHLDVGEKVWVKVMGLSLGPEDARSMSVIAARLSTSTRRKESLDWT